MKEPFDLYDDNGDVYRVMVSPTEANLLRLDHVRAFRLLNQVRGKVEPVEKWHSSLSTETSAVGLNSSEWLPAGQPVKKKGASSTSTGAVARPVASSSGAIPKRAMGKTGATWTASSVKTLLMVLKFQKGKLQCSQLPLSFWQGISDTLYYDQKLDYSPEQIREKVRLLKQYFFKTAIKNKWEFYDQMEFLYGIGNGSSKSNRVHVDRAADEEAINDNCASEVPQTVHVHNVHLNDAHVPAVMNSASAPVDDSLILSLDTDETLFTSISQINQLVLSNASSSHSQQIAPVDHAKGIVVHPAASLRDKSCSKVAVHIGSPEISLHVGDDLFEFCNKSTGSIISKQKPTAAVSSMDTFGEHTLDDGVIVLSEADGNPYDCTASSSITQPNNSKTLEDWINNTSKIARKDSPEISLYVGDDLFELSNKSSAGCNITSQQKPTAAVNVTDTFHEHTLDDGVIVLSEADGNPYDCTARSSITQPKNSTLVDWMNNNTAEIAIKITSQQKPTAAVNLMDSFHEHTLDDEADGNPYDCTASSSITQPKNSKTSRDWLNNNTSEIAREDVDELGVIGFIHDDDMGLSDNSTAASAGLSRQVTTAASKSSNVSSAKALENTGVFNQTDCHSYTANFNRTQILASTPNKAPIERSPAKKKNGSGKPIYSPRKVKPKTPTRKRPGAVHLVWDEETTEHFLMVCIVHKYELQEEDIPVKVWKDIHDDMEKMGHDKPWEIIRAKFNVMNAYFSRLLQQNGRVGGMKWPHYTAFCSIYDIEEEDSDLLEQSEAQSNRSQRKKLWTENRERLLICLYSERKDKLESTKCPIRHAIIYNEIAATLRLHDCDVNSTQCKSHMDKLLSDFRDAYDDSKRSGEGAIKFPYYKELLKLFKGNPTLEAPVCHSVGRGLLLTRNGVKENTPSERQTRTRPNNKNNSKNTFKNKYASLPTHPNPSQSAAAQDRLAEEVKRMTDVFDQSSNEKLKLFKELVRNISVLSKPS